ncbi:transcriptional regulator, TetR family [Pseudovibrio ascidiaceicola]|uniref:Transcriptional regulator, TetR family n=1 Tax=Pseudovibrio ascidiaceicola TaxID=285279 RepID=A0A1I4DNZ4_9HYPH|nr:TetR/AcrR family transcriptional regulator [Pseudovibrio ascidiaceicola]SFK94753.1 transcriptional regulator, TetR family [Pseudovibrio ascidiaceicola]
MASMIKYAPVVELLSHYGIQKATMSDLAETVGVTRQTLYNRFKTKQHVRDWALLEYMSEVNDTAIAVLENAAPDATLEVVLEAFERWGGDHVQMVRNSPHGMDILEGGLQLIASNAKTPIDRFEQRLEKFIESRQLSPTPVETTMVLVFAAKGVFVSCTDAKDYRKKMGAVINTLLGVMQSA